MALMALTWTLYLPVLECGFINFDDGEYVFNNAPVSNGLTPNGALWAFRTFHLSNWHPLTWLSYMLDVQLWGVDAQGHHFTNLCWHSANTLGLFLLLRRMTGEDWRPAFVAALFALHPLHVESVAWISERKDLLSTFFGILCLWAYVRYTEKPTVGRYCLVMLALTIGLMAKPMLVTLPCVMLLLDYWPLDRLSENRPCGVVAEKLPLLALSAASGVVTFLAQRSGGSVIPLDQFPFAWRVANSVVTYADYLLKTAWPVNLAFFYPVTTGRIDGWTVAASALCLVGITALAVLRVRRTPAVLVGWLWYLGTLVPVIGLVQVGKQAAADHYTYLPLIGVFLAITWGVPIASGRAARAALVATACAALALCLWLGRVQVSYWKTPQALWERALRVEPANPVAHHCLGMLDLTSGRLRQAKEHFRSAFQFDPHFDLAYASLGVAHRWEGHERAAIVDFQRALTIDPRRAGTWQQLALVRACHADWRQASMEFRRALELDPDNPALLAMLAAARCNAGDEGEARRLYGQAVRRDPNIAARADHLAKSCLSLRGPGLRVAAEASFYATLACQCTDFRYAAMNETWVTAAAAAVRQARLPELPLEPADEP